MVLPTTRATARSPQDVKVFGVQHRAASERNRRPWIVRWSLDGRQHSRAFRTRAEADRHRSLLFNAQRTGEPFDGSTGDPVVWRPGEGDVQAHVWVRRWLAEQWPEWQPRTRTSAVEALTRLVPLLVDPSAPTAPRGLRQHLTTTLPPAAGSGDEGCALWLDGHGLSLGQLNREFLAGVDARLGVATSGQPLGPATASRYRKVARACIRRAVELDIVASDPWPPIQRGRANRKSVRSKRSVDVRSLPDPITMAAALAAIPSHQPASHTYHVMTAIAYYAGLRPSEVVMLRKKALHLPDTGWGRIDVVEADISFDEPGEPKTGRRSVPIPRQLVELLREWLREGRFENDDLLFRTRNGKRPTASNWSRAWHRALRQIGHEPLRVYDCRHAAATTWLSAGVPLGEVARRLGHSVETLVSTYVGALSVDEELANQRIAVAFAAI